MCLGAQQVMEMRWSLATRGTQMFPEEVHVQMCLTVPSWMCVNTDPASQKDEFLARQSLQGASCPFTFVAWNPFAWYQKNYVYIAVNVKCLIDEIFIVVLMVCRFSRLITATPDDVFGQVDLNLNGSWFQMYGTGNSMGMRVCVHVLHTCNLTHVRVYMQSFVCTSISLVYSYLTTVQFQQ